MLAAMKCRNLLTVLLGFLLVSGCSQPQRTVHSPAQTTTGDPIAEILTDRLQAEPQSPHKSLQKMGFSIQVGAFSQQDNAVRFVNTLQERGIEAYHFLHESGLYKVRFSNHSAYNQARTEAEQLQRQGLIDNFFIVIPEDYTAARIARSGKGDLRNELVRTASRFLGVPYRWGGEDAKNGFDCSGLTMVSYRLNGLNLPRNSRMQYRAGRSVAKTELRKGDLVFFATKGGKRVTHVGMYAGNNQFIHAPRTGKTIRYANLSSNYWKKAYVGGRSYL